MDAKDITLSPAHLAELRAIRDAILPLQQQTSQATLQRMAAEGAERQAAKLLMTEHERMQEAIKRHAMLNGIDPAGASLSLDLERGIIKVGE
jgi:hypothetical protein